jgi:hypothetical protein
MKGDWLTPQQVADELDMSRQWVRSQILAGTLRAEIILTGKKKFYRVRPAWVAEFRRRHFIDTQDLPRRR